MHFFPRHRAFPNRKWPTANTKKKKEETGKKQTSQDSTKKKSKQNTVRNAEWSGKR